jgi:hypothetical protein
MDKEIKCAEESTTAAVQNWCIDHARLESVKKYAKVEVSARKALLEKRIVKFQNPGTNLEWKGER